MSDRQDDREVETPRNGPSTSPELLTERQREHARALQRERGGDDDDDRSELSPRLMERLLSTRTVQLFGQVDQKVADKTVAALLLLESDDTEEPITVVQNSPGGSVSDGFAIHDAMRFVNPEVRVVCLGLTASIAAITLLGASEGQRLTLPNTRFLLHQPLIPGAIFGPASDLEITAQEIMKTRERINRLLADATGQPYDKIERDTQRDYWLDANEALEYGLVDRVITDRSEAGLPFQRGRRGGSGGGSGSGSGGGKSGKS